MKLKLPETPIQPSQQKTPFWQKTRKALRSLAAGGPEKPFDGREFCLQLAAALLTFAATASGLALFGIGSAFWGLVAGFSVLAVRRLLTLRRA